MNLRDAAALILDAFDPDLQLFAAQAIENLRRTPDGVVLGQWAQQHPVAFGTIVRLAAVAAQRLPRNRGLLLDTLIDQLSRLPAEVLRAFGDSTVSTPVSESRQRSVRMDTLTTDDAELLQAAQAPPDLLREWMDAGEEERPFLMARWVSEGRVSRIDFEPSREHVTPGWRLMDRGRKLLVEGQNRH